MHKRFMVAAVAAALVLPAVASAADPELYGRVHLSLDHLDDGDDSSQYISSNSSRIGFRGDHELDDVLTLLYQLEGGVDWSADGGDGSTFSGALRDSYLGLSGGFGTVMAGRLPAANQWVYDANYFADQIGDAGQFNNAGAPGRVDNAVHYVAPIAGPLDWSASYAVEQGVDDADAFITRLSWDDGAFRAAGTYLYADSGDFAVFSVSGGFDFGTGDVSAIYVNRDSEDATDPAPDADIFTLGGRFHVTDPGSIKAQISHWSSDADDDDSTMWAFGYDHALGTDTTLHLAVAGVSNDDFADRGAFGYGHGAQPPGGVVTGEDPWGISVGVSHNF